MRKIFYKMAKRGMKGSLSRFIAITCIVALGTGFLSGLLSATEDMKNSANDYYIKHNTFDASVQGSLGITGGDIRALEDMDCVRDVLGVYTVDLLMDIDGLEATETRIIARDLDEAVRNGAVNRLELVDGRMPERADECLIEVPNMYGIKHEVGETLAVSKNNDDYDELKKDFRHKTLTVVGIVKSPLYVSINGDVTTIGSGTINLAVYVDPETYSTDVYGQAYITFKGTENLHYSKEPYSARIDECRKELKALGKERSAVREYRVLGKAKRQLKDAERELASGEKELKQELAAARKELRDSEKPVRAGERKLEAAEKKLERSRSQLDASEKELDELEPVISQLEALVAAGGTLTEEQQAAIDRYYEGRRQIEAGRKEIRAGAKEIRENRRELEAADKSIAEGWRQYEKGKAEGEAELSEGRKDIKEARKEIKKIDEARWYITDRSDNLGISGYENDSEIINAVAKVFPAFFFVVAVLVALTTLTRMIEEERNRIGTLKSLGYTKRETRSYYMFYAFVTSVIGCVVGMAAGFKILPMVISNAYSMMYNFPPIKAPVIWPTAIIIGLVTIVLVMATAYISARDEVNEKPAMLLVPKAPKPGQRILLERIPALWNMASFSYKVTLRNLFRYKKHFLMTIIGVSGCAALLMTAFGLRHSIADIVDKQYDEINRYNIYFEVADEDVVTKGEVHDVLESEKAVEGWGIFSEESATVSANDVKQTSNIMIPKEGKELKQFITLRERTTGEDVAFEEGSVVITEKMAENLELEVGDRIYIRPPGNSREGFIVTGITENYLSPYVYMNSDTYEEAFDERCEFNKVLVKTSDSDDTTQNNVIEKLLKCDEVDYAITLNTARDSFADSIGSIDFIVLVITLCAVGLAVIVLFNMANVIICERKKELATLKVLGFFNKETRAYIFREVNILAVIGILVGIPIGIWLHRFVVHTAEVEDIMFNRELTWLSYPFAAVVTLVTVFIINRLMKREIDRINMVESMKAND